MKSKIKVGDIVKTNMKNTPIMKVEKTVKLKALCYWFDKNLTINYKLFTFDELIIVNENIVK